jgi:hypothetical protein
MPARRRLRNSWSGIGVAADTPVTTPFREAHWIYVRYERETHTAVAARGRSWTQLGKRSLY